MNRIFLLGIAEFVMIAANLGIRATIRAQPHLLEVGAMIATKKNGLLRYKNMATKTTI